MMYQFVIVAGVQVLDIWYSVRQIKNILNREIDMFQSISFISEAASMLQLPL